MKLAQNDISDVLIERPISFRIRSVRYSIYPLSLGKTQLISRLINKTGLLVGKLTQSGLFSKALATAAGYRDDATRIVAYACLPGSDCLDEGKVVKLLKTFRKIRTTDLATLLVTILTMDKSVQIMSEYGMDKEEVRLSKIIKVKDKSKDKSSLSFGGKSIWGTLIDTACERYGWSYQYVLWGISFCNLQLLLSDYIKTVYVTDEERKKAHINTDSQVIKASDKAALRDFIKSTNWH